MTIVPAIDLRGGRCVRLLRGDPLQETSYDDDPVARARAFVAAGATIIHVVDLDGAFASGENRSALRAIARAVDVPIQTGGGVRAPNDVRARFDDGARYVVIGTLLVEAPKTARALVARYGDRIIAGVDARGPRVATRGWQTETEVDRDAFVRELIGWGVGRIVFTEIGRDGTGAGYDIAALSAVAGLGPIRVTASGGARTLEDLRALAQQTPPNVDAAIVGRALYEGTIALDEAIAAFAL
jgi:phosphoribosylformimino-5-aminoimidazole carboxamide ribotide isomerase